MKKYFSLLIFCLTFTLSKAQFSLLFCKNVSESGTAIMADTKFAKSADGVVVLLKTEQTFKTDMLDFRFYFVDTKGNETELLRLPQPVDSSWNYAWKQVELSDPGVYRVKIYNGAGSYLTSANVSITN